MKHWKAGIIFLVAFLIQTSLINLIAVHDRTPNLLLAAAVVFAFLYGDRPYAICYGAFFGMLYDVFMSPFVGATLVPLVLVVLLNMWLRHLANLKNIIVYWIYSAFSLVVYYGLHWIILHYTGNPIGFLHAAGFLPIPLVYTFIVLTILYLILVKGIEKRRKGRFIYWN